MAHWLVKTEPSTYSWEDLVRDGKTCWDGVRNFQARRHLRSMRVGEKVLIYHSVKDKAVVGVAEVMREAYPDPTSPGEDWSAVDLRPLERLERPVSLASIRDAPALSNVALVRQGRLSVMPLEREEFEGILALSRAAG